MKSLCMNRKAIKLGLTSAFISLFFIVSAPLYLFAADQKNNIDFLVYGYKQLTDENIKKYEEASTKLHQYAHPDFLGFNCVPTQDRMSRMLTMSCVLSLNSSDIKEVGLLIQSIESLRLEPILKYSVEFSSDFLNVERPTINYGTLMRYIEFEALSDVNDFNQKYVWLNGKSTFSRNDVKETISSFLTVINSPRVLKSMAQNFPICAMRFHSILRILTAGGWKESFNATKGGIPEWPIFEKWSCWGNISEIILEVVEAQKN